MSKLDYLQNLKPCFDFKEITFIHLSHTQNRLGQKGNKQAIGKSGLYD